MSGCGGVRPDCFAIRSDTPQPFYAGLKISPLSPFGDLPDETILDGSCTLQDRLHRFASQDMRRRRSPQSLASILKDVVSSYGFEDKFYQGRIVATWQEIAGERIGREVEKTWVKDKKLFVRIKSPVWRQELHLNRDSWCRRLNEELGEDCVKTIVFR